MYLYSVLFVVPETVPHTRVAQAWITQCYLQLHRSLPLPYKRSPDGAFPDWGCGHLIAAYFLFIYSQEWKAESAWLTDSGRVYPHKWSPVSCRSSAGQGKFASQRPTFYHCATQLLRVRNATCSQQPSELASSESCWLLQSMWDCGSVGLRLFSSV